MAAALKRPLLALRRAALVAVTGFVVAHAPCAPSLAEQASQLQIDAGDGATIELSLDQLLDLLGDENLHFEIEMDQPGLGDDVAAAAPVSIASVKPEAVSEGAQARSSIEAPAARPESGKSEASSPGPTLELQSADKEPTRSENNNAAVLNVEVPLIGDESAKPEADQTAPRSKLTVEIPASRMESMTRAEQAASSTGPTVEVPVIGSENAKAPPIADFSRKPKTSEAAPDSSKGTSSSDEGKSATAAADATQKAPAVTSQSSKPAEDRAKSSAKQDAGATLPSKASTSSEAGKPTPAPAPPTSSDTVQKATGSEGAKPGAKPSASAPAESSAQAAGPNLLLYALGGTAAVGLSGLALKQTQDLGKAKEQLAAEQASAASLQRRLTEAQTEGRGYTSSLQALQSRAQQLEQSLASSQDQATQLQTSLKESQSDASTSHAQLAASQAQEVDMQQQMAAIQEQRAELQGSLSSTDFERVEALKQVKQARTGIANLRNRLDESEAELRNTRVQSSLQMTSLSIDLRSRQQQIELMRAELQRFGGQAAAQRQQNEQASENLMERLAIAQTISADTQSALEEALEDGSAAKGKLTAERESTSLLSKARTAAVEDTKKVLAELREAKFQAEEQLEALTSLNSHLAAAKAEIFNAQQTIDELQQQAEQHQAQEQHLLDELDKSQVESGKLQKALKAEKERSSMLQRDLGASLRDSKEALHREAEIMSQLEQQDERILDVSGKLQQSQADLMASRRQAEEAAAQLAVAQQQIEGLTSIKAELTQVVKSQTQQALELADQMQKLQQDSSQLASTEQDLQLAEDRTDHLQDALTELRESMKASAQDAQESQNKVGAAEAEARAEADRVLLQEQIKAQASTIDELREALASQLQDLETTQAQLEATQSSLIDLESHLTSLEEDSDEDEPKRLPSQVTSHAPTASSQQANQSSKDADIFGPPAPLVSSDAKQQVSPKENDALASAVVNAFHDLFPASSAGDVDDASAGPELSEDPVELFQRGKAAVEARALQPAKDASSLSSTPNGRSGSQSTLPPEQSKADIEVNIAITAAQQVASRRAAESRAQAAMMVEAVEDRAYEAVMEAQAEAAKHAAEADRLRHQLQQVQGQNGR